MHTWFLKYTASLVLLSALFLLPINIRAAETLPAASGGTAQSSEFSQTKLPGSAEIFQPPIVYGQEMVYPQLS